MAVQKGSEVAIHYTLTVDGDVVDTSKERGPLTYKQGEGQIISGLDKEIEGMNAGDKKQVTVTPEEGYGMVDPRAFKEIPRSRLPADIEPAVGMNLQASLPDGRKQNVRISEVKGETIILDANHPLAGKTLHFDVEVVSVT